MSQSKITFANGDTLVIQEGEFFVPIVLTEHNGESFSSMGVPYEISGHVHDGLIPSITTLCLKSGFFYNIDEPGKVYNPSTIVSIENI